MNGQQGGYLPVNPERVEGPYISGLPLSIPFQPQLNVPPHIQQISGLTMGVLIMVLQDNAQKNPLRTFLFNLASMNSYRNEIFEELLITTLEYVDHLMTTRRYQRVEDAIDHAAKEVCAIMSSVNVERFPALQRYIADQAMAQDIQGWIQRYQALAWEIRQSGQAAAPTHAQWQQVGGTAPPFQGQGWPAQSLQQPWQTQPAGRPAAHMAVGAGADQDWRQGYPMARPHSAMAPSYQGGPRQSAAHSSGITGAVARRAGQDQGHRPAATATPRRPAPSFNRWDKEPAAPVQEVQNQAKENKAVDYDDFFKEDGSQWRPAFKSGWVKTPNPNQPYTPAYDPTKNILYHRRLPDGTVTEVLMDINDDNEYLLYELNPTFARKTKTAAARGVTPVDWDQVGKAKTTDEIADDRQRRLKAMQELTPDATEDDLPELEEPRSVFNVLTAASEAEASLGAAMTYLQMHKELPDKSPLEYAYTLCTPIVTDRDVNEELDRILASKTLSDAAAVLTDLAGKIPARIWHYVNDRLTTAVNEALKANLGSKTYIESFADDMPDLIEYVKSKEGEHIAMALANHGREIIRSNAYVLRGDQLIDYLEKLELPTNDTGLLSRITVFGEQNVTTEVPWFSHELNVELSDGPAAILESRLPSLHKAVSRIFARNRQLKVNKPRNNYILTKDNVRLKVYEGWIGKDFYLIQKA